MSHVLLTHGGRATTVPLTSATLVGRAPACLVRVHHAGVPAHWLEIRWRGAGWAWRALAAEERTRGTGASLDQGWRRMDAADGRGTRVAIADVSVELLSAEPPGVFVWDLAAERAVEGEALDELVEVRGDVLLPLSAEGDLTQALRDGQCWLHEGSDGPRMLRAHVPQLLSPTVASALDLRAGDVSAIVELAAQRLTLRRGDVRIEVRAACVRALALYARSAEGPGGERGWTSAAEAWGAWVELGGSPESPVDAVAWERGRLRRLLDRAGVAGLDALVERRKLGPYVQTRLGAVITAIDVRE